MFCLLSIILFACSALAGTFQSQYVEGEVLVLIKAPTASDYYSIMGVFSASAYSRTVSNQAENFARSRGLEAGSTFPRIAKISGESIILLRSRYKTQVSQ